MAGVKVAQPCFALLLDSRTQQGGVEPDTTGTMCTMYDGRKRHGLYNDRNGVCPRQTRIRCSASRQNVEKT